MPEMQTTLHKRDECSLGGVTRARRQCCRHRRATGRRGLCSCFCSEPPEGGAHGGRHVWGQFWGPYHISDPKAEPAFPEAGGQRENPCGVWGAQRDGRAPNWDQRLRCTGSHSKDRRGQVCMSHNERVWEVLPSSRCRRQSSGHLHHGLDPSPAPLLTLCTGAVHGPPSPPPAAATGSA